MTRRPRAAYVSDGFKGQRLIVVPRSNVLNAMRNPLLAELLPTDAGYFPTASRHRIDRPGGAAELVVIYCMRGRGWVETSGWHSPIEPGWLAILPPGTRHAYGADEADPWSIYWVHLTGKSVQHVRHALSADSEVAVQVGDEPSMGETFEEIISALEVGYGPDQLLLGAGLAHLLVSRLIVNARRAVPGSSTAGEKMDACVAFLQKHLTQKVHVNRLAAMANYSPQHFAELFKRHTGFSPIDFFLRQRLQRAMELVVTTHRPMKQIAQETGFLSQLYFSRQFKRIYGSPPTAVRLRGHHRLKSRKGI